jgi:hypothetical protein
MVGTSGKTADRLLAAVANALSLPAAIWPTTVEAGENIIVVRPAIRSAMAGGLP